MLPIHFAPIQGQTDLIYRTLHHRLMGGIARYYTPFVRWEKDGLRNKDRRDIDFAANAAQPTSVQIIFRDLDEFLRLVDEAQQIGWQQIDLNLGCPFPLQARAGRGAGILQHPDIIEQILKEITNLNNLTFSVKMRSGMVSVDEGLLLLPMLDSAGLASIAIHPRLGTQQYKGRADRAAFRQCAELVKNTPLIYNGDITTPQQISDLEQEFPNLRGVMIGRGLLSRPTLAQEYLQGKELSAEERLKNITMLHDGIFEDALARLQGDSQILSRMQAFWKPCEPALDKKAYKSLTRCGTLRNYREAVANLRRAK